jgi:hypothetical protein
MGMMNQTQVKNNTQLNFATRIQARASSTLGGGLNKAQLDELNVTGRNFEPHQPSTYK